MDADGNMEPVFEGLVSTGVIWVTVSTYEEFKLEPIRNNIRSDFVDLELADQSGINDCSLQGVLAMHNVTVGS